MKAKKKILIVDDAVVVRRSLADAISRDSDLEVSATASNGKIALTKFSSLRPDLVLLDIEMPEMDGLEALSELRKLDRRVPIVMFSTLTERGAEATLDALSRGATDYITKPSNSEASATVESILRDLIPKIRWLCGLPETTLPLPPAKPAALPAPPPARHARRLVPPAQVVAIGVSTGGPDALARLLPTLPAHLKVPVLIAQHMPPSFTSLLARRLSQKCALPVRECVSGETLAGGCIYLAPGDFHMVVSGDGGTIHLRTHQGPKENFCRPSVDVLFRSVAEIYGSRTLAIILTGMGQDGVKGCEILSRGGGRIVVQDEATSVVWGMPGFVARAGLADKILPLDQIGVEIVNSTKLATYAHP